MTLAESSPGNVASAILAGSSRFTAGYPNLLPLGGIRIEFDAPSRKARKVEEVIARAMEARDETWDDAVEKAGLEWLKANARRARIATLGWCMGGGESLKASLNDPKDVNATVMFYGRPVEDVEKLKAIQREIHESYQQ